ncbi:MAG: hypothetical protein NNA18_05610 [Nitrospira sp.]|nr:hypothetical protein [Nitrospira sp.]
MVRTTQRNVRPINRTVAGAAIGGAIWLSACATPVEVGQYPHQQRMVGKSMSAVLACAGEPTKTVQDGTMTLLRYYREAPILEESQPTGKSSFATIRHGCWATVIVVDDRVLDIQYRFVPPGFDASNDCESIFESCSP